jgi:hypothetical protein
MTYDDPLIVRMNAPLTPTGREPVAHRRPAWMFSRGISGSGLSMNRFGSFPGGPTEPNAFGTPIAAASTVALPPVPVTAVTCRSVSADRG